MSCEIQHDTVTKQHFHQRIMAHGLYISLLNCIIIRKNLVAITPAIVSPVW